MTLPTFEDIMLPLVEFLGDNKEKNYSEVISHLSHHFKLDPEDLKLEKFSGGNYFYNKIGWAKNYLTRAGILDKQKGKFKISVRGLAVLKQKPPKIDRKFLHNFEKPYYWNVPSLNKHLQLNDGAKSPDELIDDGLSQINTVLIDDLSQKLKSIDPISFEQLLLDLIEKLGYGKGKHVGKSGDGGIDGEIPQDKLGLDMIYLQAKRYSSTVPIHDVRDFLGSLSVKKANKGIFITTSNFPQNAHDIVAKSQKTIILINGQELIIYMIKNNVGVKTKKSIQIKEIDEEYFDFDSK